MNNGIKKYGAEGPLKLEPILKSTAKVYALHYLENPSPSYTRSIHFDLALQHLITQKLAEKVSVTGMRIYLARYNDYQHADDPKTPVDESLWGRNTVIIALTSTRDENGRTRHIDINEEYYNYGAPCPPSRDCELDEGLFQDQP